MNTTYITISGIENPLVATTAEAVALRDSLLDETHTIQRVSSAIEAEGVAGVLKRAKQLTRFIEDARKDAKEKPLQVCRDIDAHAKELTDELETEAKRIGGVLAAYQIEQNRIAEEARQAAAREVRRIQDEADRVAREAEAKARKEYEDKMAAVNRARTAEGAAKRQAEAERIRAEFEADEARRDAEARAQRIDVQQAAVAVMPRKQVGVATKRVVKFRVKSLVALYEAAPYLVKLEPNVSAITNALKGLEEGQQLPGIEHWYESESVVR